MPLRRGVSRIRMKTDCAGIGKMTETRETVEKLKHELKEVRAIAAPGRLDALRSIHLRQSHVRASLCRRPAEPLPGRGAERPDIWQAGAIQHVYRSTSAAMGIKRAETSELAAAVQTTRAIIAEHA